MEYTRVMVATKNGFTQVMTGEMRNLMKKGVKPSRLVPAKDFKGPKLVLDSISANEIKGLKREIASINWQIKKLEFSKSLPANSSRIAEFEAEIERLQFEMFELQSNIRDVKKACYKNQTSMLDLEV